MSYHDLQDIIDFVRSRTGPSVFRSGELIFCQGDAAKEFYFLKKGLVRVYTITADGNERNILLAWPGRFFAASSFFNQQPRQTTAVALNDVELLAVDQNLYQECAEKFSSFQHLLLEELSMELFTMFEQLADVSLFSSAVNVARFICRRSTAQASEQGDPSVIAYSQDVIASILGLSRWSVNKALAAFKERGWVKVARGKIILLDFESLYRFAYDGSH